MATGRFYQFDRDGDMARLVCLDARTGKLLWQFRYATTFEDLLGYNNGPRSTPLVDEGRVYIFGAEGMLHCLRADNGEMIWNVDTAARFGVVQNFFGVGSSPVVDGELLLVMVGGSPPESQNRGRFDLDEVRGNGSGLVAFNKRTGAVKYHVSDELASYTTPQLATIAGRRWGFCFARGGLIGFEPTSGTLDFHYPWRARLRDSVNASSPVVVGDEVFISECYGPGSSLLRVRPGGYDVVWHDGPERDKALQLHWNTAIYHEGYLYGSSGRHTGEAELRLCPVADGPGDVAAARAAAEFAAIRRRAFRVSQRRRHVAAHPGHAAEIRAGGPGHAPRIDRWSAAAETAGLGRADPRARPALRPRR